MSPSTLTDDEDMAYRVAALPPDYGETRINQLFTRGYNRYVVDGEDQLQVHEPSGTAFDSSIQLAVFHRGWTAGRDADGEGE